MHSKALAWLMSFAVVSMTATAQSSAPAPMNATSGLREALEAAWQRHPWPQSEANRRAELVGRKLQAQGLISAAPTLGLSHSTDRIGSNNGLRGLEAELSAPLWNNRLRSATQSQIERDEQRLTLAGQAAKLKLSGELRELAARYELALADQALTKRKLAEASTLAEDVSRRLRVGDVARVDALMAQSALAQASAQLENAQAELASIQNLWFASTGLRSMPALTSNSPATQGLELQNHPHWLEAQATVAVAQAKLASTLADSRDPVEVGVSAMRERSARGSPGETSMKFAVRIPFGGASRNDAKAAAARADLDEAQTAFQSVERQLQSEQTAASTQLGAAQRLLALAEQRARLAAEAQGLYAKAYRLGESDLATRLRADNEKFDADLALSRALLQRQRAQSLVQHSQGLLP